jgi:hypothetical protein
MRKHTLSGDFAPRITALCDVEQALRRSRLRPDANFVRAETLRKKVFSQHPKTKKLLRKCAHVLFSAPILIAR